MLCRKPYCTPSGQAYGCGQCMPCRVNKRRIWSERILLEAQQYESNAFVTLTYDDEKLPVSGKLEPKDLQGFLKRLRSRVYPDRVRFYAVGEYGDITWRPHYHLALFGFRSCLYGQSQYSARRSVCCVFCDLVRDTWGKGHVFLGALEASSAEYLCGYVTKKMTSGDDPRLAGRHPEFARMSLRPGIGRDAMFDVADVLMRYRLDEKLKDVPNLLSHGRSARVIGRYLRRSLRKFVGKDGSVPQAALDEIAEKMRPLQMAARVSSSSPSFRGQILNANEGRFQSFEARRRLYKRGRPL